MVDYESACSQVEDVPMPFVQAKTSLGLASASTSAATTPTTANAVVDVLREAPPAIAYGDGESACSMVGDVPMSPVDARLPPTFTLAATITTSANTVGDEPSEGPVFFCQELARKQVEDVPLPHIDTSIPSTSARAHATVRHTSQLLLHTGLSQPMDCLHLRDYAVPLGVGLFG